MSSIWFNKDVSLVQLSKMSLNTMVSHLGIELTKIGDDTLEGTMPVDERTFQPARLLHGGASCVLAETLGSVAANMVIDTKEKMAVGQHIEATHLRSATKGHVRGVAKMIYMGRSSQTWRIEIFNDENKLICDSKIIMAIVNKK
ncbi:hotdog fold thioesterase [Bacteriovorax sp. PP10]|uniref:Hotdog fold thioesterase n=1 Tax=Bacteriovorax antarcticus TaxID=3088717 RepID=A0ABU5VPF0_9BACT|nr:hotdog fold thioesterase [Bacteriovorax sp. PP10]MEA9354913.1 hotdog fold thioesterase [Bacteriovorax sp. PP10]